MPGLLARIVARAKPHVPEAAWPTLLTLRSLAASAPVVGLPALRRVLVVAPHPDDETIGCGGTIALLARGGAQVRVVLATAGEATIGASSSAADVALVRRAEAESACRALGVAAPRFLDVPDGQVAAAHDAVVDAVRSELDGVDAVFAPWILDGHRDHAAVASAVLEAIGDRPSPLVWGYETWTPLPANRIVDITASVDQKRAAMACHATAGQAFELEALLGLNRYRSVHGLMGRGHAEAFLALPASAHGALLAGTRVDG